jgi:predicted permease
LFGLAPALQSVFPNFLSALKGEAVRIGRSRFPLQKVLLIGQVGLSLTLLIGTTLFVRSLHNLRALDLGFHRENVFQVTLDPAQCGYKSGQIKAFYRQVLEKVSIIPGVRAASLALVALMDDNYWGSGITVEGYSAREGDPGPLRNAVGPEFFKTTGIPVLIGREFSSQDSERARKVAVVNEEFARFYFGDQNPVGKHIGTAQPDTEIVGVVRDGKHATMREGPIRFWYVPYEQMGVQEMTLYVRTAANPGQTIAAVRKEIASLDPSIALYNVKTLEMQVEEGLGSERLIATLSTFFSLLATLLAAIGLYGVLAHIVARQTREIGVRIAVGARPIDVLKHVIGQGMLCAVIGIIVGGLGALALGRIVSTLLFGIGPADPLTFMSVTSLFVVVTLVACWFPARQATKVDPMETLRHE